ncbi:Planctomycete cytochrome C [Planctomycetales bacterium 10988]|nr:Planctomycete cytochrome C [Planctomycetales bacterium 10988]
MKQISPKNLPSFKLFLGALLLLIGMTPWLSAEEKQSQAPAPAKRSDSIEFAKQIQPILAKRCYSCHGPDEQEGGFRLDTEEGAFVETHSGGFAIVAGEPEESLIIERILTDDEYMRMPPEGEPLKPREVKLLTRWIEEGAEWEKHWGFRKPIQPEIPEVSDPEWINNPIDAFILSRLEEQHLQPTTLATKQTLIRRAYFNLTGLPPTPAEVDAFLRDESSDAWSDLLDRLLASPHYGERWARHWLDLVRYADTNSFERDGDKPNAWRYRDYVIRSFNEDKPYNQFVKEQLAGDELDEVTPETITATAYYRLGLFDDEPADPLLHQFDQYDDIVATTSQVFLGLTVDCARCHDHKIDPIPQTDYYRLLAFFRGLPPYAIGRKEETLLNFSQRDITSAETEQIYEAWEAEKQALRDQILPLEQKGISKMPGAAQRATEGPRREKLLAAKLDDYLNEEDWQTYTALKAELEKVESRELPPREVTLAVNGTNPNPEPTYVMLRGNPHVLGEEVTPGFPELFEAETPDFPELPGNAESSGRRRALAEWIASDENLFAARVMVNRLWQHHFGRGIVRSTNNFGQLGDPPTHPKLLDWLAYELVKNDWKLKPIHRLIMQSKVYQLSSEAREPELSLDPANDLFWRFNMRRLDAEEVRDAIHAVTGELNPKMFGPGIYPEISAEVLAGQSRPGKGWGNSSETEQARRSVYIFVKRSLITPILAEFDFAETDRTCAARFSTTQPTQALAFMNSPFLQEQSARFAERLQEEAGSNPADQVTWALELALSRLPSEEEVTRGVDLIERLQEEHSLSKEQALTYFCLVTLNLNEFLYLD